ncbi:MAG: DUF4446 family protein [Actinomycetes bacterium]
MTSSSGLMAIAAIAIALTSIAVGIVLAVKLRRLKADQTVLLGSGEPRDLVAESAESRRVLNGLVEQVELTNTTVDSRFDSIDVALSRSISGFSLVRYDAYDEASGQQSVSIALVDSSGSGVVLSSLVRRESARLYARLVGEGSDESALSPEEVEAVKTARERTVRT